MVLTACGFYLLSSCGFRTLSFTTRQWSSSSIFWAFDCAKPLGRRMCFCPSCHWNKEIEKWKLRDGPTFHHLHRWASLQHHKGIHSSARHFSFSSSKRPEPPMSPSNPLIWVCSSHKSDGGWGIRNVPSTEASVRQLPDYHQPNKHTFCPTLSNNQNRKNQFLYTSHCLL